MLFHGIKIFLRLCRSNVKFTLLSIICLFSSFFSLLFLFERGYFNYIVDANTEQETQVLYLSSQNTDTIENIYNTIIDDPTLPELNSATVSGDLYTGLFWNIDSGVEPYYTPYGRFFSSEEISTNANVALLGIGYLSSLPFERIESIWDIGIKINNVSFAAIGNYNYNWGDGSSIPSDAFCFLPLPTAITIPIKTFWDIGLEATRIRCVFSQPLTEEQEAYLNDLLAVYNDELQELIIPQTEKSNRLNMINQLIKNIAPFALIILLSIVNISNIILHWLRMELVRFQIYRICGANNGNVILLISIQVSLLVLIGYIFAFLAQNILRMFIPYGIIASLPGPFYWIILAGQLLLMILLVLLKSFRLLSAKNLANFSI